LGRHHIAVLLCASLITLAQSTANKALAAQDDINALQIPSVNTSFTATSANSRARNELPSEGELKNLLNNDATGVAVPALKGPIPTKPSAQTLTLQGAVTEASEKNQDINHTRLEVSRFKWDYAAAQAARLPNMRVLSYLSQQTIGGSATVPPQANGFVFLSALMPVTQQYKLGLQARAIKLASEITGYRLMQELDDTRAKVKAAYYKVCLDQSKMASLEVSIKYLRELETTTANRVKEGNSLKVESLQVAARLSKNQLDLVKAKNELQIDREKFNHLLGRDIGTAVTLEAIPAPDQSELDKEGAERKALSQRPEILAADARLRQINLEKRIRLAEYIPSVSIGAVYVALPGFNNNAFPKNTLAPGIFIHYDAFDWGRRAFLARAQSKSESAQKLHLASVKDEVLIDLHTQMNKLTEARMAVQTSKFARDVAAEELRVAMNRYKFTSDKLAEVLGTLTALADASNNYEQSLLAFWQAKAEYERAMGD
jgi:outer membrane protein TolC